MLKKPIKKGHSVLVTIIVFALLVSEAALIAMHHYSSQAQAQQLAASEQFLLEQDRKIFEIRKEKLAEQRKKEEAERKKKEAAERKKAAEAALRKQLAGQVVTPPDCGVSGAHGDPSSIDVVINKKNCFDPVNYVPGDLVSYGGYVISAKIKSQLVKMITAAAKAGKPIALTSAYRSYSDQVTTYNHWVSVNGSYAAADKVSARPGYSEHQTGFAVDIGSGGAGLESFANTAAYAWMKSNAHKYGFIQRYKSGYESITGYSAEAWHWRYVGIDVATDMKNKGVHTLEQYWNIDGGSY
jgi:D-alanyl-D-alanine carboxypeptidase